MAIVHDGSNISNLEVTIESALSTIKSGVEGVGSDPVKLATYAEAIRRLSEAQINVMHLKTQSA
jgi:hypothetical protein